MDYVLVKASQHELQKKLKGWRRKVEITALQTKRFEFDLFRMRHIWVRMTAEATQEKDKRGIKSALPVLAN